MDQNFIVKAFRRQENGCKAITFVSCHSVEVEWEPAGGIAVMCLGANRDEDRDFYIAPPGCEPTHDECTEVIVENAHGNTVHRWTNRPLQPVQSAPSAS